MRNVSEFCQENLKIFSERLKMSSEIAWAFLKPSLSLLMSV